MKQSILFVDDDVNILNGLQRMLRSQRDRWSLTFVDSGQKALELIATHNFDVVVSDMRMPDLDGAALLSEVERRSPSTLRVILSGYSEEKSIFRTVGPAHQYLAKPCDPLTIIALMDRAQTMRALLAQPKLRALVAGMRSLPSPPDLYLKLTEEMRREETSLNTVVKLIETDVAMTAALLKLTNSAYFSLSVTIGNVSQAVRLLGLETVRTLVLSVGIFKQFGGNPDLAALVQGLNDYSLTLAHLARQLAKEDGADEVLQSQALCAGMLCCIGSMVLLDADPIKYRSSMETFGQIHLEAAERKIFGATQAELGAYLLGLWGFDDAIVEAVLYQMRPSDCVNPQKSITTYVHLARTLGPAFPLMLQPDDPLAVLDRGYVERLGLTDRVAEWSRCVKTGERQ
ncbi:MAG TPA: response regulator [Patescibacteria group bacterium]|nr:response regulator [Patescibacteria group bacterium]